MAPTKPRVLVFSAGDASDLLTLLGRQDAVPTRAETLEQVTALLNERLFDCLFIDVSTSYAVALLGALCERWPEVPIVAFCSKPSSPDEARALYAGAVDVLRRPLDEPTLVRVLKSALVQAGARAGVHVPLAEAESSLLGQSPSMVNVRETIERVAPSNASVLIRGETGTGKEMVARALHAHSTRTGGPFVKVHAPSLPDTLLESELFGHEKGAFTGATARKPGRVELAQGGTLFLDEIAEMSPRTQVKLLRLIQDREFERVGGTQTLQTDTRFVTATHRDIEHMMHADAFREDLFYRINVVTIWLPPLRARRDDIPLIATAYLEKFRTANQKLSLELEPRALRTLQAQRWPGNVRQLVNFIERLVVMTQGDVIRDVDVRQHFEEQTAFTTQSAPREVTQASAVEKSADTENGCPPELDFAVLSSASSCTVRPLREEVRIAERRALEKALRAANGNRSAAARLLGISRRTLYSKLDEHGFEFDTVPHVDRGV